eukprot:scaffold68136_cov55-Phaeocystis_antarctica.AAC.3
MRSSLTVRACPDAARESDGVEGGRERFLSNPAHHIPNVVLVHGAESPLSPRPLPSWRRRPASWSGSTARCGQRPCSRCTAGP